MVELANSDVKVATSLVRTAGLEREPTHSDKLLETDVLFKFLYRWLNILEKVNNRNLLCLGRIKP